MNYLTLIFLIMSIFAIAEILCSRNKRLCQQIYNSAFFTLVFLVCIKYYIGPDIAHYGPYFDNMPKLEDLLFNRVDLTFEYGYNLFSGICIAFGLSFWEFTVVIALLYYTAIWLLFKQLTAYKTFALYALVILDYNLMLFELRQCLAVTFLIFAILSYQNRYYFWSILCIVICCSMHKSGIVACAITAFFMLFWHLKIDNRAYLALTIILCAMLIIPLNNLGEQLINSANISTNLQESVLHHLQLGKNLQTIFPIYFCCIICLAYYSTFDAENRHWHWMIWLCVATLVFLYQYWYLLNRIRSYFLPFIIVYMQRQIATSKRSDVLPRQIFATIFFVYATIFIISSNSRPHYAKSHTNDICTIFDLINGDKEQIIERQYKEASLFWEHDFNYMISQQHK